MEQRLDLREVGLTPGLAQASKEPFLLSKTIFSEKDDFTATMIERTANPRSTTLSTDPQFDPRQAAVVR